MRSLRSTRQRRPPTLWYCYMCLADIGFRFLSSRSSNPHSPQAHIYRTINGDSGPFQDTRHRRSIISFGHRILALNLVSIDRDEYAADAARIVANIQHKP
ncbi:hypothetical protein AB1N83_005598 [Pleurotus pulmonarius]